MTSIGLIVPRERVREVKLLLEGSGFAGGKIRRVVNVDGGVVDGGGCLVPTSCPVTTATPDNEVWSILGIHDRDGISLTHITTTAKSKDENPLTRAIANFLRAHRPSTVSIQTLLSTAPRRYNVYPPLLLLPANSFSSPAWGSYMLTLPQGLKRTLYEEITRALNTDYLALNAPIPARDRTRSPANLTPLHGPFPAESANFDGALWVSTTQSGIYQTWSPTHSMFSRGNVGEKARLLRFPPPLPGSGAVAVDMFAGIGYFAFSYVRLGYRVLAWEINAWSVEGLRRGCAGNGWGVRVVPGEEEGFDLDEEFGGDAGGQEVVVFLEDNERATRRVSEGVRGRVERVNLGLLPTSRSAWGSALGVLSDGGGWVHVHENVAVGEIDGMVREVVGDFKKLEKGRGGHREISCEHVERVKTFAPGVVHCVFDVRVRRDT